MPTHRSVAIGAPSPTRFATPADAVGVTDSVSAVWSSAITHGRQINATNTGIAKWGLVQANLTAMSGGVLATSGNTYTERVITSTLDVTGSNNTFIRCLFTPPGGATGHCVELHGSGNTFIDCTVFPSSGSRETGIRCWSEANSTTIQGCNIYGNENNVTFNDANTGSLLTETYMHDSSNATTGGHLDGMEVYGSFDLTISKCRIVFDDVPTACINIAPYSGSASVNNLQILDNFLDGGQRHILADLQSTGYIRNIKVLRNDMGGHTYVPDFGRYESLGGDYDVCETQAQQNADPNLILWPTTGPDVNRWAECSDLSPDRTGEVVVAWT